MKRMKPNTYKVFREGKPDVYINTITGHARRRWWTKARIPGTVRNTRLPGGSGYRNNWEDGPYELPSGKWIVVS